MIEDDETRRESISPNVAEDFQRANARRWSCNENNQRLKKDEFGRLLLIFGANFSHFFSLQ